MVLYTPSATLVDLSFWNLYMYLRLFHFQERRFETPKHQYNNDNECSITPAPLSTSYFQVITSTGTGQRVDAITCSGWNVDTTTFSFIEGMTRMIFDT